MSILHYLDVAIGFTLAMMVLTTLVGTTTAVWLAMIRTRVRNLEAGLQQVLSALGEGLTEAEQRTVVASLLRDKMMNSWSPVQWLGFGATEAVGREEFVLFLLRRAESTPAWKKVGDAIQAITNEKPQETLRAVEKAILDQEAAHPNEPASVWRTRALAQEAPELSARVFSQFDDILTRTDDRTAYSGKLVAAALALIFLVVYPVNAFDVLARLVNNGAITQALASQAEKGGSADELLAAVKSQGIFGDVFVTGNARSKRLGEIWHRDPPGAVFAAVQDSLVEPGVWTTFILVSLGAPFWQELLNRLLGLRSKITAKTEEERAQRGAQNSASA